MFFFIKFIKKIYFFKYKLFTNLIFTTKNLVKYISNMCEYDEKC